MASATVVLAVGTIFMGHASSLMLTSSTTSLTLERVESVLPVRQIICKFIFLKTGNKARISSVSPLLDIAIIVSSGIIIPISPCIPSAGCRKNAGVPVLAKVAAIFLPINPDLPIPVTTTLPLQLYRREMASVKLWLSLDLMVLMALASMSRTLRPVSISFIRKYLFYFLQSHPAC